MRVVEAKNVAYILEGIKTIIFRTDGDMRQALNKLQAQVGEGQVCRGLWSDACRVA